MTEFSWFWNARGRKHGSADDLHPNQASGPADPQVEGELAEVIRADEENLLPPLLSGTEFSKEDDRGISSDSSPARDLEALPSATIPSEPALESEAIPPV